MGNPTRAELAVTDTTWMDHGRCAGAPFGTMFPIDNTGVADAIRQYCDQCPVRVECAEYALANRIEHGLWGGLSERARRRILKGRRAEQLRGAT